MVSNERTLALCFAFIFAKSKSSAMLNLAATSFEKADYKFRSECLAAKFVVAANFADSMDLADTNFIVWNRLVRFPTSII